MQTTLNLTPRTAVAVTSCADCPWARSLVRACAHQAAPDFSRHHAAARRANARQEAPPDTCPLRSSETVVRLEASNA